MARRAAPDPGSGEPLTQARSLALRRHRPAADTDDHAEETAATLTATGAAIGPGLRAVAADLDLTGLLRA